MLPTNGSNILIKTWQRIWGIFHGFSCIEELQSPLTTPTSPSNVVPTKY